MSDSENDLPEGYERLPPQPVKISSRPGEQPPAQDFFNEMHGSLKQASKSTKLLRTDTQLYAGKYVHAVPKGNNGYHLPLGLTCPCIPQVRHVLSDDDLIVNQIVIHRRWEFA